MSNLHDTFAARLGNNIKGTHESMKEALSEGDTITTKCRLFSGEELELHQLHVLDEDLIALQHEDAEGRVMVLFCRPEEIRSVKLSARQGNKIGFKMTVG